MQNSQESQDSKHTQNPQKSCVFMGDLEPNNFFFMRLENAFLLSEKGAQIEIVSDCNHLEKDLAMWCRFKGEEFVQKQILSPREKSHTNADSAKSCASSQGGFAYILRKNSPTRFPKFAPPQAALQDSSLEDLQGWDIKGDMAEDFCAQDCQDSYMKASHMKDVCVEDFSHRAHKQMGRQMQNGNVQNPHIAPQNHGLAPQGARIELASPQYHFAYTHDNEIYSSNVAQIYEEAKRSQWNATSDIAWREIPHFSPTLEFAIAQIMTYLTENEFSALYIPSRFLGQISPYFTRIPLLLSSIIGDEARHIESFIKRANATGLGVQYSTLTTQQSLYSLWKQQDYFTSSFLLHIMGEGTFIDLLRFLEEGFSALGDEPSARLLFLARRDEVRHVAYGMSNVKHTLSCNPAKITVLKNVVFARKNYLDSQSAESSLLLESLALLRGGGEKGIKRGFEEVMELKKVMELNRTKRLVECGIDEELARDLSRAHTPNFM